MKNSLKKGQSKIYLLSDIDMLLLMVEKCISGGICHHQYVGADNKYMKNDREKNKRIIFFLSIGLYRWAVSQLYL